MQSPQPNITDDFNTSTRGFLNKTATSTLLLTKYSLLLNFTATEPEQKEKLAESLLDCAIKFMSARTQASYRGYLSDADYEAVSEVLERLSRPDSTPFLPARAPQGLAKVGFDFIRCAESSGGGIDGQKLTRYAALCAGYAEKLKEIADNRTNALATGKNITPAKRIVLKQKDAP